jgi:Polyketide cyclase / dehydrase and lipid transport
VPVLKPVDERYFDLASQRFSHTWSIARPAQAVWAELTSEQPLHWLRGIRLAWTSPQPFGVGTTRRGKVLGGLAVVDEHFFIWEEGRRCAFYITRANLPAFISYAEDYLIEPAGSDGCSFTWRIALTPSRIGRPGGPLNKLAVAGCFRDTDRYFNAA